MLNRNVKGYSADYHKGETVEPHLHEEMQIVHARSGVMRVVSGSLVWIIPPGRALWVPCGVLHEIHCLTAVKTRTVYLSGTWPGTPECCEVWQVSPLMREIIIRFADEPDSAFSGPMATILAGEIDRLDVVPINLMKATSPQLVQVQDGLLANPADSRTLADWAQAANLSPRTMMRRLNQETGITFREWRRQIRMLKAVERLAEGLSVTEVAFDVGYETTSAFIAAFRQTMGRTPARYFER